MVYIYPTTIITSTGRSTKYATQELSNKAALCSNSTTLAYWGVKKPTYKGHPLRNYPDSVTTPSGSFYKPEYIYATGWDLKDVASNALVKKIVIEYKWEQIAYSSLTSFGKFDKPTISIIHNGKTLTSIKGAKPEAIRYNNNKTNKAKMNTNYAELATLHSHTIDVSKYNLTVKDLKKLQIKFNPAKNQASNHCRIVMQFLRLNVTYQEIKQTKPKTVEILPVYRVSSKITPNEVVQNEEWVYECTIKSQTSGIKPTTCKIDFSDRNIQLIDYTVTSGNSYNPDTNIWTVNSFTNKTSKLILRCKCSTLDNDPLKNIHKISTTIKSYADSVNAKTISSVTVIPHRINLNVRLVGEKDPYIFNTRGETIEKCFALDLTRDIDDINGKITLTTDGWLDAQNDLTITQGNAVLTHLGQGTWEIRCIQGKALSIVTSPCKEIKPGTYVIEAKYTETNKEIQPQSFSINVIGNTLDKEFFKLRLEDGSDVRYNSLMFAPGDDLTKPLTYDIISENDLKDHIIIKGEEKTIPVGESRYIGFTIELKDTEQTYENILAYIDVVDTHTGENCFDILMAADSNIQLFQGGEHKYCIIDSLKPDEIKKINFVVQSDTERTCDIRLKPFNYDYYETIDEETGKNKWTPSRAYFRDMPNVKISVDVDRYELDTNNNANLTVTYTIENKSTKTFCVDDDIDVNVTGYKFKLIEPSSFKINGNACVPEQSMGNNRSPQFNEKNRILTLPCIQGAIYNEETNQLITHPYRVIVNYTTTQKGIYDFKICTEDNPLYIEDDQYKNCAKKQVLVNIDNNVKVKTFVSKQRPYVNELIDYTIQVKNYTKPQDQLIFNIYDIGSYETDHDKNDYVIEYANYSDSVFEPAEDGNHIGTWTINNVGIGDEYELVLTLRPTDSKYHVIQAILKGEEFTNLVNVLEPNKKLSFDVHHAVDPTGENNCSNCNMLTEICDEDYINLNDELYYVISVTNNSKNPITEAMHIYARLPEDLLTDNVLCYTNDYNFTYNETTKLISFTILSMKKCETKKICFKIKPTIKGTYISNFMLTSHNAHTYHKQLTIHVNDEFDAHKMEHEITIYNFEKTNRYFRYELDGDSNIFKFFNQGNRPTKYVEAEDYKQSSIEYYKGSNLKKLLKDIAANSKYVEPELLRIGNNKLQDKGYELYPDGFIRRFGLLNSEIFHYSGQLPTVGATVDYAMRWNEDYWDNKVWGGGIYENGVFDLTIDYSKVPTNFDILNISNPIGKLQALVDKAKPFGTQAICYYSDTVNLNLKTDIKVNNSETETIVPYELFMPDDGFDLISYYNRHDNSIAIYYDMFAYSLKSDIIAQTEESYIDPEELQLSLKENHYDEDGNVTQVTTDLFAYVDVFDQTIHKQYISESLDIVQNAYDINTYNNIDITKDYHYEGREYYEFINTKPNTQYTFEYNYADGQSLIVHTEDIQYSISYSEDLMNNFKGFTVYKGDEPIFKRNLGKSVEQYHIQIETYQINTDTDINDESVIHFWIHTDDNKFYHLGYVIVNDIQNVIVAAQGANTYEIIEHEEEEVWL